MSFENEQYVSSRVDKIEALEQEITRLKRQLVGVAEQLEKNEKLFAEQNEQLKQQLEKANEIIRHVIYDHNDSSELAYKYLEQNNLLS